MISRYAGCLIPDFCGLCIKGFFGKMLKTKLVLKACMFKLVVLLDLKGVMKRFLEVGFLEECAISQVKIHLPLVTFKCFFQL